MSQRLTVELSDEVFNIIRDQAAEANISPAEVASVSLERYFHQQHEDGSPSGAPRRQRARGRSTGKKAELQAARLARERFEKHFGAVDLGYPTGVGNEAIDADLEREYANVVKPA